jgi:hypothetical protein
LADPFLDKYPLAHLQQFLRIFAISLSPLQLFGLQDLDSALVRGAVPHVVHHGDQLVSSVPDYMDDLCLRADPGDFLDELRVEQRRLVPNELLVRLREPL